MFRSRAERKVADAGYDPARLPPGQYLTEKWPVLHAGSVPQTDLATWDFRVFGEVESRSRSTGTSSARFRARRSRSTSTASRAGAASTPVPRRPLERAREARPSRSRARASSSLTPSRGSRRTCRSRALEDEEALIAYEADGEPLTPDHGWPLRLVDPDQVLLEERQVAARARARRPRPARLLGALRLPQRGRPLEGRALPVLTDSLERGIGPPHKGAPIPGLPTSPTPRETAPTGPFPVCGDVLRKAKGAGSRRPLSRATPSKGALYIIPPMPRHAAAGAGALPSRAPRPRWPRW